MLTTRAMVATMIPKTTARADEQQGTDDAVVDGGDGVLDRVDHPHLPLRPGVAGTRRRRRHPGHCMGPRLVGLPR